MDSFDAFKSLQWVKKGTRKVSIGDTYKARYEGEPTELTVVAVGLMLEKGSRTTAIVAYVLSKGGGACTDVRLVSFHKFYATLPKMQVCCRFCCCHFA